MPQRTTPLQDATKHILEGRDKTAMLEVKHINPVKGRGIFSTTVFSQGDFVVEYRGVLVDSAEQRRKQNQSECSVFWFDFTWKRRIWSIDGGEEDGSFGRLVNDEHKLPNCRMKLIEVKGKPHLCLFALKEIKAGTEINYDYGGTSWPWREEIPLTVTTSAAQGSSQDCIQDKIQPLAVLIDETRERPDVSDCNRTSGSPACETQLSSVSNIAGQHFAALDDQANDLDPADLSRDAELKEACQFSATQDCSVYQLFHQGG
ncbi:unnamed protein product [Knipowitschia caucasica]